MKLSQKNRIIRKLKADGFVTRNECLKVYISRLGAIICDLSKEGWIFHAYNKDGDYVYEVVENPIKPIIKPKIMVVDGVARAVY